MRKAEERRKAEENRKIEEARKAAAQNPSPINPSSRMTAVGNNEFVIQFENEDPQAKAEPKQKEKPKDLWGWMRGRR